MPIENPYAKRLPSDRIGRIRTSTSTSTGSGSASASAGTGSSGSCRTPHPAAAAATTNAAATTAATTAATITAAAASASSGRAAAPTAQAQQLPAAPPPQQQPQQQQPPQQQQQSIPYHARLPSRRVSFAAAEIATVSELAQWLPSLPVDVDRGSAAAASTDAGEDASGGSSTHRHAAIAIANPKAQRRSVRVTGVVLHVDLPGRFVLVGDGAAGARPSWGGASAAAASRGMGAGAGAGAGRGGWAGRGLGRGLGRGVGGGIGIGKGSGISSTAQKTPLNRYARTSMGGRAIGSIGSIGSSNGRGVGTGIAGSAAKPWGSAGRGLHVLGNRGRTSSVGGGIGGMGGMGGMGGSSIGNHNNNHNHHNHNHNGLLNTAKKRKLVYTGGKKSAAAAAAAAANASSTAATAMGTGTGTDTDTGTGTGTMDGAMATPRQGGLPSSSRRSFPGAATGAAIGRGLLRTPRTTGSIGIGSSGNPKRPRPSSTTPPPRGGAAAALEVLRQQRMRGVTTTQAMVAVDIASLMPLEANVGWTVGDTVTVFGEVRRMVADATTTTTTTTAPVPVPVPAATGRTSARIAAFANSGTADAPAEASTEVTTDRPSAPPPSALHLVLSALETNGRGVTARIIRNTNGTDVHLLAEALRLRRKYVRERCAGWPPPGRTSTTLLVGVPGMGVEALMTGKFHNKPNDEVKKDGTSGE